MDDKKKFFTLVFEGDLTKLVGNPLLIHTPYGRPIATSLGNAFDEIERLEEEISELDGKLGEAWSKHGR